MTGLVLLVDDEEAVQASTAEMSKVLGYTVVEAGSAEEALQRLDEGIAPDLERLLKPFRVPDLAAKLGA